RPHGGGLGPGHRGAGNLPHHRPGRRPHPHARRAPKIRGGPGGPRLRTDRGPASGGAPGAERVGPVDGCLHARLLRQPPRREADRCRDGFDCRGGGAAMTVTVRVGTRASALAVTQTTTVAEALAAGGALEYELVRIKTEGDVLKGPLAQIGGTGVFVAALREALLDDRCDVAVHSLKDLPTGVAEGLQIAA